MQGLEGENIYVIYVYIISYIYIYYTYTGFLIVGICMVL